MSAEYDLREKPNPKGDGSKQTLHPRLVSSGKITTQKLVSEIASYSSFTAGDVEGILSLLADRVSYYISEGYTVQLGEIGYFSGSLKATHGVMDKKDIRSTGIYFDNVNFRASKRFKQQSAGRLERSRRGHNKSAELPKEERLRRMYKYLDENLFITRTDYTRLTGLLKNKALSELKELVEEGALKTRGRGSQLVFMRKEGEG
ncbi:DNA-binding protein [Bacteroides sp. OttesenSCG-928-E20]|nr:DNA-binding protein [Bacteroides sp. OttesenSCG-928-N06]MDL2299768.1 DNA-binding protein [Bacteroides sp. OttesenSCG-928-E20]